MVCFSAFPPQYSVLRDCGLPAGGAAVAAHAATALHLSGIVRSFEARKLGTKTVLTFLVGSSRHLYAMIFRFSSCHPVPFGFGQFRLIPSHSISVLVFRLFPISFGYAVSFLFIPFQFFCESVSPRLILFRFD